MNFIKRYFLDRNIKKGNWDKVSKTLKKNEGKTDWKFLKKQLDQAINKPKYLSILHDHILKTLFSSEDKKRTDHYKKKHLLSKYSQYIGKHLDYAYLKDLLKHNNTSLATSLKKAAKNNRIDFMKAAIDDHQEKVMFTNEPELYTTMIIQELAYNLRANKKNTNETIEIIVYFLKALATSSNGKPSHYNLQYFKEMLSELDLKMNPDSVLLAAAGNNEAIDYLLKKNVLLDKSEILKFAFFYNNKEMIDRALEIGVPDETIDFHLKTALSEQHGLYLDERLKEAEKLFPYASKDSINKASEIFLENYDNNEIFSSRHEMEDFTNKIMSCLLPLSDISLKTDMLSKVGANVITPLHQDLLTSKESALSAISFYEKNPHYLIPMEKNKLSSLKEKIENSSEEEILTWGKVFTLFGIKGERTTEILKDKLPSKEEMLPHLNHFIGLSSLKNKKIVKKAGDKLLNLLDVIDEHSIFSPLKYLSLVSELGENFIASDKNNFDKFLGLNNFDHILRKELKLSENSTKNLYLSYLKQEKSWDNVHNQIPLLKDINSKKTIFIDIKKLSEDKKAQDLANKVNDTFHGIIEKILIPALARMDKEDKHKDQISSIIDKVVPSFFEASYSNSNLTKLLKDSERYHWYQHTINDSVAEIDSSAGWPKIIHTPHDIGGGYKIIELNTKKALKEQGKEMKQCIGGYTNKCLGNQNYHIFKVINSKGENCATVSIKPEYNKFEYTESPKGFNNSDLNKNIENKINKFLSSIKIHNDQTETIVISNDKISVNMEELNTKRKEYADTVNVYELTLGFSVSGQKGEENWHKAIQTVKQFLPQNIGKKLRQGKIMSPVDVLKRLKNSNGENLLQVLENITGLKYPEKELFPLGITKSFETIKNKGGAENGNNVVCNCSNR